MEWFPIVFVLFLCIFAVVFISTLVRGVLTWGKNNAAPVLTVGAVIRATREAHRSHHTGNDMMVSGSYSRYYATFEFASGSRIELAVPHYEIGMLAVGDRGQLTFQGTRFIKFERI
ncbi:MAG: DUF2500 domain-containing protein [Oscillospiraceae bacterium]